LTRTTTTKSNACRGIICAQSPRDVAPNVNVLWSSGPVWHGIRAELCQVGAIETPQFQTVDHSLVIHLSAPALVEVKTDGDSDIRQRVPGDLAILPATAVRQVRSRDPHEVLAVAVSQEVVVQTALDAGDGTPFELTPHPYYRDARLEHICWALKAEAESDYASGPLYGESLALAVCVHLLKQRFGKDSLTAKKGGIAPRTLRRVLDYIESNLDNPLRMADLAELAGLSQYRFAHNFKCATGVPPYQCVLRARLDRAKQMLRQTDLSVLDIAYAVGYQSIGRFNSLFRRELGTTPSSYRASFR
jgi:AraC family transcriptional regulator